MKRLFALVIAIGTLAGCTNYLAQRQTYLGQFVGRPEGELVAALGVPNRTYETGGIKYLAFEERRVEIIPGTPIYAFPPYYGFGGGFPPQVMNLVCETTVAVVDGIVRNFSLRGNACG